MAEIIFCCRRLAHNLPLRNIGEASVHNSVRGKIVGDWKRDGGKFALRVRIPANTTATVSIPARSESAETESGKSLAQSRGMQFLRMENGRVRFAIESGEYVLEAKN